MRNRFGNHLWDGKTLTDTNANGKKLLGIKMEEKGNVDNFFIDSWWMYGRDAIEEDQ